MLLLLLEDLLLFVFNFGLVFLNFGFVRAQDLLVVIASGVEFFLKFLHCEVGAALSVRVVQFALAHTEPGLADDVVLGGVRRHVVKEEREAGCCHMIIAFDEA